MLVSDGAVAGRPAIAPCIGAELTVQVSVSPSPSVIANKELIEVLVLAHRLKDCVVPWSKVTGFT
mgnify:CR=1 FL=1